MQSTQFMRLMTKKNQNRLFKLEAVKKMTKFIEYSKRQINKNYAEYAI